jgi:hypothetical protein
MAESPLLLIGGAAPTLLQNRGALQVIKYLDTFMRKTQFAKLLVIKVILIFTNKI